MTKPVPTATTSAARWPWVVGIAAIGIVVTLFMVWPTHPNPAPQPSPTPTPVAPAIPVATPLAPERQEPSAAPGVERDLFPNSGLAGWEQEMGTWSNRSGTISGLGEPTLSARLISKRTYGDGVLTCRLRLVGTGAAEIQLHDHDHVIALSWGQPDSWLEVRIEIRGNVVSATGDGQPLTVTTAATAKPTPGTLGFLVRRNARLEITHARITELASPRP